MALGKNHFPVHTQPYSLWHLSVCGWVALPECKTRRHFLIWLHHTRNQGHGPKSLFLITSPLSYVIISYNAPHGLIGNCMESKRVSGMCISSCNFHARTISSKSARIVNTDRLSIGSFQYQVRVFRKFVILLPLQVNTCWSY